MQCYWLLKQVVYIYISHLDSKGCTTSLKFLRHFGILRISFLFWYNDSSQSLEVYKLHDRSPHRRLTRRQRFPPSKLPFPFILIRSLPGLNFLPVSVSRSLCPLLPASPFAYVVACLLLQQTAWNWSIDPQAVSTEVIPCVCVILEERKCSLWLGRQHYSRTVRLFWVEIAAMRHWDRDEKCRLPASNSPLYFLFYLPLFLVTIPRIWNCGRAD
jgi:hypothetical protein